jgi:hypothetical protein
MGRITVWLLRGNKRTFNVKIESSAYRKKPYRFYVEGERITTDRSSPNFGMLYGQICYLIRKAIKEKTKVSQEIRGSSRKQRKIHKKKIPASAYAHQLRCDKMGIT